MKFSNIPKQYAFTEILPIDLSLAENPLGFSPKVSAFLSSNKSRQVSSYPDPECRTLRKIFARRESIPEECVVFGNGSEQLIELIVRGTFLTGRGKEVLLPELTFPLFAKAVVLSGGTPVFIGMKEDVSIDLEAIKKRISTRTRLIFLCSPNNPTGMILAKDRLVEFIKGVPRDVIIVVDEANIEFGGSSVVSLIPEQKNLVVLRTFSKAFGLAGLRVGACLAAPEIISRLMAIQQPFAVNTLAQECAIRALSDSKFLRKTKQFMDRERKFLVSELKKRGFAVSASRANTFVVRFSPPFPEGMDAVAALRNRGVSVVDGDNFRGLGRGFARISPRLRKTNIKFLDALDEIEGELRGMH